MMAALMAPLAVSASALATSSKRKPAAGHTRTRTTGSARVGPGGSTSPAIRPAGSENGKPVTKSRSGTTTGSGGILTGNAGGLALTVRHDGQLASGLAHAAAAIAGSIVDFSFSPATITIHVGDSITWTNVGKQPHSATANNGSFNTGILQPGQSASHTFTTPGTYTYYCLVHPWMHGTVVVLAAATTPSTTTHTSSTSTTTTTTTTDTSSANSLPMTGLDLAGTVLGGAGLVGIGFVLRRRLRQAP